MWRGGIEGEATKGARGDEFAGVRDGDGGCREGTDGDGVFQYAEGAGEARVLIVEGRDRERCGLRLEMRQRNALVCGVMCPVIAKSEGWVKRTGGSGDGTSDCGVSLRRWVELCTVWVSIIS